MQNENKKTFKDQLYEIIEEKIENLIDFYNELDANSKVTELAFKEALDVVHDVLDEFDFKGE